MDLLKRMESYDHEMVVVGRDKETGLKTIIAIHDSTLGPACGGTRFWNYESEEEAVYDVLRLSRGMTLKNAGAGLALGGGKAVIIGDPKTLKSRDLFHAYGKIVNSLGGKYYTAEDVNISADDIALIHEVTPYVTGTPEISGNPSPFTARGVFAGIRASAKEKYGSDSLAGKTVAVMGLGSVGFKLCEHLHADGARLKVFDINQAAVDKAVAELGASAIAAQAELIAADCDILAPCALGAVLNTTNVNDLKCGIICGCANNVLVDSQTGEAIEKLGILYAPDFIVNAGGVINCAAEVAGNYSEEAVNKKVDEIYETTLKIFALAKEKKITTYLAAEEYSLGIINAAK